METRLENRRRTNATEATRDMVDRVQAEHRQALLAAEVQHRVQNTLAVVQSIAQMSFAGLGREVVAPFEQRLMALAGIHDLLVQTAWEAADLRRVLERACDAFPVKGRIDISGPAVGVTPTAAVVYGLAFHELCANAVKHGAFSSGDGRLEVSWSLAEPDLSKFRLVWREYNGPLVTAPTREGFGSRLLKRALAMQLGASVIIRYPEDGLICEFDGPVQRYPGPTIDLRLAACG